MAEFPRNSTYKILGETLKTEALLLRYKKEKRTQVSKETKTLQSSWHLYTNPYKSVSTLHRHPD